MNDPLRIRLRFIKFVWIGCMLLCLLLHLPCLLLHLPNPSNTFIVIYNQQSFCEHYLSYISVSQRPVNLNESDHEQRTYSDKMCTESVAKNIQIGWSGTFTMCSLFVSLINLNLKKWWNIYNDFVIFEQVICS